MSRRRRQLRAVVHQVDELRRPNPQTIHFRLPGHCRLYTIVLDGRRPAATGGR